MKKMFLLLILAFSILQFKAYSEGTEQGEPISADELKSKIDALEENTAGLLTDVLGLKKIKISGYLQAQFEKTENFKGLANNPYDTASPVLSGFRIRRGRVKVAYDAGSTQFVIQGDYSNKGFELKDAYLQFTEPWMKYFTMTVGLFNRPNYEVEYSSSQRESMERSAVVRTLYPGERDLGAMLTFIPDELFKLQLAAFNNTYQGAQKTSSVQYYGNSNNPGLLPDYRDEPLYFMARITKEFKVMDDLGIDIGAHARFGSMSANSSTFIPSEKNTMKVNWNTTDMKTNNKVTRTWFGVEAQLYYDFLGGMKILGEYIFGNNADDESYMFPYSKDSTWQNTKTGFKDASKAVIRKRTFSGYYVMLVKNLGTDFQLAVKYDSYNPNTKIKQSQINSSNDLAINTVGFGIHNYTFPNIRISVWYDMVKRATNTNLVDKDGGTLNPASGGKQLFATAPVNNLLTIRFQYKF